MPEFCEISDPELSGSGIALITTCAQFGQCAVTRELARRGGVRSKQCGGERMLSGDTRLNFSLNRVKKCAGCFAPRIFPVHVATKPPKKFLGLKPFGKRMGKCVVALKKTLEII